MHSERIILKIQSKTVKCTVFVESLSLWKVSTKLWIMFWIIILLECQFISNYFDAITLQYIVVLFSVHYSTNIYNTYTHSTFVRKSTTNHHRTNAKLNWILNRLWFVPPTIQTSYAKSSEIIISTENYKFELISPKNVFSLLVLFIEQQRVVDW